MWRGRCLSYYVSRLPARVGAVAVLILRVCDVTAAVAEGRCPPPRHFRGHRTLALRYASVTESYICVAP
eukprot:8747538-Pyramimonas_sp.AAC.1